ncbi:hypothetical protein BDV26DRAFT_266732 [Aspergillus bertholletiae]|uniref:Uncharacterized protein n=1 Tax=Aspergillus bertholletiae TaxID=1226010 RepID=A0A5N7B3L7_9EURO|nr:hypothetical protein BDV26DRAFT_266732 [Aspergillus bertholletiae]
MGRALFDCLLFFSLGGPQMRVREMLSFRCVDGGGPKRCSQRLGRIKPMVGYHQRRIEASNKEDSSGIRLEPRRAAGEISFA